MSAQGWLWFLFFALVVGPVYVFYVVMAVLRIDEVFCCGRHIFKDCRTCEIEKETMRRLRSAEHKKEKRSGWEEHHKTIQALRKIRRSLEKEKSLKGGKR